jgi:hypothetical protein
MAIMRKMLTVAQIEARYPNEWVLVGDPETDKALEVRRGRVLCHSKDHAEFERQVIQARFRRAATLYTGRDDGVYVL